jgi:hypothetical protein
MKNIILFITNFITKIFIFENSEIRFSDFLFQTVEFFKKPLNVQNVAHCIFVNRGPFSRAR